MALLELIGKLKNKYIILVLLGFSSMAMAKEEIEVNFFAAPTLSGGGDIQRIIIKGNKQFYYKKTNIYNSMIDTIQGIGVVSGRASLDDWNDYKEFKDNIFIKARDLKNVNAKAKRISVKYKNEKNIYNALISLDNNEDSRIYENWFRDKKRNFANVNNFTLEGGFTIDHFILKKDKNYEIDLLIENKSENFLQLSGVKTWEHDKLPKSRIKSILVFSNDDETHQIFLNSNNLDRDIDLDKIIVNPRGTHILKFKIPEKNIDKFLKSGREFVTYINLNLNIENDFEVSGGFSYSTKFKKIM